MENTFTFTKARGSEAAGDFQKYFAAGGVCERRANVRRLPAVWAVRGGSG